MVSPTWSTSKGGGFLRQQRDEKCQSLRCAECEAHGTLGNRIWLCWLRPKWGGWENRKLFGGKRNTASQGRNNRVSVIQALWVCHMRVGAGIPCQ